LRYSAAFFLLTFAFSAGPAPQAAEEDEDSPLTSEIELGAIYTSGNTKDENFQFRGEVNYSLENWDLGLSVDGFRSSKNDELAARRIYTVSEANYNINEQSFALLRAAHDDDRFSGYDGQSDVSLNYGRNLLANREDMGLTLNVGGGYRYSRSPENDFDEAMLRLAADYDWKISDSAGFRQEFSAEAGGETRIYRARSSIDTEVLENLLLRFSVDLKHQSRVPAGREKTDTETSVTFVMRF